MNPSTLRVTGVCHVVLHVSDLERSVKFYRDVLGLEGRELSGGPGQRRAFLRCEIPDGNANDHDIGLFEVPEGVHGGEDLDHFALYVNAETLDEVEEILSRAGVDASPRSSLDTVFIHDPDGHQIEVLPLSAQLALRDRVDERTRAWCLSVS